MTSRPLCTISPSMSEATGPRKDAAASGRPLVDDTPVELAAGKTSQAETNAQAPSADQDDDDDDFDVEEALAEAGLEPRGPKNNPTANLCVESHRAYNSSSYDESAEPSRGSPYRALEGYDPCSVGKAVATRSPLGADMEKRVNRSVHKMAGSKWSFISLILPDTSHEMSQATENGLTTSTASDATRTNPAKATTGDAGHTPTAVGHDEDDDFDVDEELIKAGLQPRGPKDATTATPGSKNPRPVVTRPQ
ncbi:uncharacterized protein PHACADRAFT_204663 [Phanerochaete carnosa HHB-10118-sp]|uniref:Uncharacterized protein n=1 Tax=Phanerochaete carnosa (strain HHB-10118-sp) TaxID=650164 RepID=K5WQH2_PHACS|nr:uncharacterized protein PHACADRAFT_204663 [Phanerochaete carnosa HHB-10118-sp]EKM61494.1 hypothetical protein PHACADRAFT_204663 [Phanerochaete carnosa HHB-10118-sp]